MKQHRPPKLNKGHTAYKPKDRTVSLKSAAWAKLRAQVLAEQPLCQHCMDDYNMVTPATDVDHIDNDGDNNERGNLASLCHSCHSKKTAADMRGQERAKHYGCDINGRPLDPNHHWNQKITSNREPKGRRGSLERTVANKEFSQ